MVKGTTSGFGMPFWAGEKQRPRPPVAAAGMKNGAQYRPEADRGYP